MHVDNTRLGKAVVCKLRNVLHRTLLTIFYVKLLLFAFVFVEWFTINRSLYRKGVPIKGLVLYDTIRRNSNMW